MARTYKASGVSKAVAATTAQTIVFTPGEIEGAGVIAYLISLTENAAGANNDFGALTRVRVKANGVTFIDLTPAHLKAYVQRMSRSNFDIADGDRFLIIPLMDLAAPTWDLQDIQQFPRGAQPTVEITTDNSVAAGTMLIGYIRTTVDPLLWPRLIGTQMNIAASQNQARFTFSTDGVVAGLGINTVGLTNLRAIISGEELIDLPSAGLPAGTTSRGDMLFLSQLLDNVDVDTDPAFLKLNAGLPADSGSSYVLLDTSAAWVGAANELVVYEQLEQ